MTKFNAGVLAAWLAVLCWASTATALPLQLELGPYAGAYLFSDQQDLGAKVGNDAPAQWPVTSATVGGRVGAYYHELAGIEGEFGWAPAGLNKKGGISVLTYRVQAVASWPIGRFTPFLLVGCGALRGSSKPAPAGVGDDTDPELHWGLGVKVAFTSWFGVRLDLRHLQADGIKGKFDATNFEVTLSPLIALRSSGAAAPAGDDDPDGDGVRGAADSCPEQAGPAAHGGCPLADEVKPQPVVAGKDKPEPVVAGKGKTVVADQDGDGIPDDVDKCPGEVETVNGYLDGDGCPDVVPAAVKKLMGSVRGVTFAQGKEDPDAKSLAVLDKVAKALARLPELKVVIAGYAHDESTPERNLALSRRRAEIVRDYLVHKGVPASRLRAVGHGVHPPVAAQPAAGKKKAKAAKKQQDSSIELHVVAR